MDYLNKNRRAKSREAPAPALLREGECGALTCPGVMTDRLQRVLESEQLVMTGGSVAVDKTAREVSERQFLPGGGLRERFEQ